MKKEIIEYMTKEREKLVRGEVDELDLEGVCPRYIGEVFGRLDSLDLNGWEGDYWANAEGGFCVSGCMWDGSATITLEEKDEEEL